MPPDPAVETHTLTYPKDLADPKRWLNFVQLDPFPPAWKGLELDDEDLRALEIAIMLDPERPPVVLGTGGLRKIRFAPKSWAIGKRGAARVCYVYFRQVGLVALVFAYGKGEKDNLTAEEKRAIKKLIREIETYLEGRRKTDKGSKP